MLVIHIGLNQHGFMKGRSTITNLAVFTQEISEMWDFSRAFDSISHAILLHKLDNIGCSFPLLELLGSYLLNRVNYVFYHGFSSHKVISTTGVPQGSDPGPLHSDIFLNDLLLSPK